MINRAFRLGNILPRLVAISSKAGRTGTSVRLLARKYTASRLTDFQGGFMIYRSTGLLVLYATCLAFDVGLAAGVSAVEKRPNIIVVLADDLGFSDVGCYGGEIPTPHLDALAEKGIRFRQVYNNAVCGPTRASLLTGLYCQQIGHSGKHWNEPTDFRKCVTIGEVLQQSGYRTLMVGKWQERELPAKRGFDRFFGPMCQAKISYFNEVQQNPFYLDEQRWKIPAEGFYMTDAFTDHAVRFIKEAVKPVTGTDAAKPFFLYLAYVAPHWPLHAREADIAPHRERYRKLGWDRCREERFERQRKLGVIPETWKLSQRPDAVHEWKSDKNPDWQAERMAVYAAQVTSIDRGVGQVMKAVQDSGTADNTLVLFLSDNGAAPDGGVLATDNGFGFGPKLKNDVWRLDGVAIRPGSGPNNLPGSADSFAAYGLGWATVSNTPFRSTKTTAYEGGIRTPMIAHWPAVIKKGGQWTNDLGHVMDLMTTCLEVAGAKYPQEFGARKPLPLEGRSLAATFRGDKRADHEVLCWNAPRNQAIRQGSWKLINSEPGKAWELFDLETDGGETKNLAEQHPQRVRDMAVRWGAWARRVGLQP